MYKYKKNVSQFNFGHFSVGHVWNPLHTCAEGRQVSSTTNTEKPVHLKKNNLETSGIFQRV